MTTYTLPLKHVDGRSFSYSVDKQNMVVDRHGHILAFTVVFDDGGAQHFIAGDDHSFPMWALSTLTNAASQMGQALGVRGVAVSMIAKPIVERFGRDVILHHSDYYTDNGRKVFHGPPAKINV